jgi:putative membrane protein insertion efficiency factor
MEPLNDRSLLKYPLRVVLVFFLRLYRYTFSFIFGRTCRYLPTCSEYMEEAVRKHGAWAGTWMGFARFCRCNPLGGSGFDPPPERLSPDARWYRPWTFGQWRTPPRPDITCEAVEPDRPAS